MTLEQITYFMDVAETLNISASAQKFFISPQGLSRSLKALQRELNTELLRFHQGHIELTAEGVIYVARMKDMISRMNEIHEGMKKEPVQKIQVVVSTYLMKLTIDLFHQYQQLHPDQLLMIREMPDKSAEQQLLQCRADLALLSGPVLSRQLKCQLLCEAPDYFCIPKRHRLANSASLRFQDIRDEPFVTLSEEYKIHDCYVYHMRQMGSAAKIVFIGSSLESVEAVLPVVQAVTMGNPQYHIQLPDYVRIPVREKNGWRMQTAVRNEQTSPPVRQLARFLHARKDQIALPSVS